MFKKLKAILSKKQDPSKPAEKTNTGPPFERLCGYSAMLERRKNESWSNPNNQVKPTFRKRKPLYYNGERITACQRQPEGDGFRITFESGEHVRLTNRQFFLNVAENG